MRLVLPVLLVAPFAGTAVAAPADRLPRPILSARRSPGRPSIVAHGTPPQIDYAIMRADAEGATHVAGCTLTGFALRSYAPPSAPLWLGIPPGDIASISYNILPIGYVGEWHGAPGPQWVVVLSGRWSVEATDGTTITQGPGEILFNADTAATVRPQGPNGHAGHLTRQIGDVPNVQLVIALRKDAMLKPAAVCEPVHAAGKTDR